jgi:hypothetical protein
MNPLAGNPFRDGLARGTDPHSPQSWGAVDDTSGGAAFWGALAFAGEQALPRGRSADCGRST